MSSIYEGVFKSISRAGLGAFLVDPMNPRLAEDELRDLVLQDGHAGPLFDEAYPRSMHSRMARQGWVQVLEVDVLGLNSIGQLPPQMPIAEADRVLQSFDSVNRQQGVTASKSIEALATSGLSAEDVRRGLGLLLLMGLAKRTGDGFVSDASVDYLQRSLRGKSNRSEELERAIDRVRALFAAREGNAVPTTSPIDRLHLFLKKQGQDALAGWWAMTTQELRSLGDRHPTASTVLAASMLEAALVAIAEPAKSAGEWRKKDLLETPDRWKMGTLIDQAEAASTFSKNDAVLARTLADLRNRIHVGKFAVDGPERFKPPFTNTHDATIAVKHLEMLLAKILDWPPIAALG